MAFIACPYTDPSERVPPLGAMSVLAYAQKILGERIETHLFDLSGLEGTREEKIALVVGWRPDVIGLPVYTSQVSIVDDWMGCLRTRLPDALFVAGGPHATLTARTFLDRRRHLLDAIVVGDGEEPFVAILRSLETGNRHFDHPGVHYVAPDGRIVSMPDGTPTAPALMANPFEVPITQATAPLLFSDRRTGEQRPAIALVSSRSCPLTCAFCAIVAMPGKWRAVPTETLLTWLRAEHARSGYRHIYFMDANFFVVPRRVRDIATSIAEHLPGVTWSASATVGMLLKMENDLPTLARHGLRMVEIGIEAASDAQLAFLRKRATPDMNRRAVAALQRAGLDIGIDFIMFNPDQTMDDLVANVEFLRECHLTLHEDFDHLFTSLILYPGTPLRETYAERRGKAFDPDELPDITPLFRDSRVRVIHRDFTQAFAQTYMGRIKSLLATLRTAATRLATTDPVRAQHLRLETIRLHHLPLTVLRRLCRLEADAPLEASDPRLAHWEAYEETLRALCAADRSAAGGPSPETGAKPIETNRERAWS